MSDRLTWPRPGQRLLAVDTETTGLRVWQGDKATMASFADDTGAWALPAAEAGEYLRKEVAAGTALIMHNGGIFDRAVFRNTWGIDLPDDQYWDTLAVDWLLDENADHRLKEGIGSRLFGVDARAEKDDLKKLMRGRTQADVYRELREVENEKPRDEREKAADTRDRARDLALATRKGWADLTFEDLHDYAVQDAALTWQIFHWQQGALEDDTYVHPYVNRVHDVMSLSYRINREGIRVSEERCVDGFTDAQARAKRIQDEHFPDVNLKSPKQVAELLYDDWKLPAPEGRSTAKDALNNLSYDERVQALLEYRSLVKQVDAYFLPLLDHLGPDSRIHPSLHPCRTVTGRWSCSEPNLQTIPRESTSEAIRGVFEAGPGLELSEIDLSQIEVRIAADMARETALLQVYEQDGDVYQALADEIGVDRSTAKRVILSAQYGIGPRKLSIDLATGTGQKPNYRRARAILDSYWRTYPQLDRLMKGLEQVAQRRGYVPLWKPGRRRLFRSPHNPYPRYYTALNAAIQGGAAELMKDILWEVQPEVQRRGLGRVVLTVHDSIIFEHEPGPAAQAEIADLVETVTEDVSPFSIPTPWEMKTW